MGKVEGYKAATAAAWSNWKLRTAALTTLLVAAGMGAYSVLNGVATVTGVIAAAGWLWGLLATSWFAAILLATVSWFTWSGFREVAAAQKESSKKIQDENERHRVNMLQEWDSAYRRVAQHFSASEKIAKYHTLNGQLKKRTQILTRAEAGLKQLSDVRDNWQKELDPLVHRGFRGLRDTMTDIKRFIENDATAEWQWPPEFDALDKLYCPHSATEYHKGRLDDLCLKIHSEIRQFAAELDRQEQDLARMDVR